MNEFTVDVLVFLRVSGTDRTKSLLQMHEQRVKTFNTLEVLVEPDELSLTEHVHYGDPFDSEQEILHAVESILSTCEFHVALVAAHAGLTRTPGLRSFIERMMDRYGTDLFLCD